MITDERAESLRLILTGLLVENVTEDMNVAMSQLRDDHLIGEELEWAEKNLDWKVVLLNQPPVHVPIVTDDRFWDCECSETFIHAKVIATNCGVCNGREDECSDSRVDELAKPQPFYSREDALVAVACGFMREDQL